MPGTAELVMLVEFSRSVHSKYIEQQIVVYFFSNRHIYKLLGFWSNQINNIQQSYDPNLTLLNIPHMLHTINHIYNVRPPR